MNLPLGTCNTRWVRYHASFDGTDVVSLRGKHLNPFSLTRFDSFPYNTAQHLRVSAPSQYMDNETTGLSELIREAVESTPQATLQGHVGRVTIDAMRDEVSRTRRTDRAGGHSGYKEAAKPL
ncbi:hypothetical protein H4Q26_006614 [Puccinia striiformis f. sp. tritici PST-130]|nr:hypothetical protein H4Q26_006614 [Puccinia striiformis f. sp. tritici PST-130]